MHVDAITRASRQDLLEDYHRLHVLESLDHTPDVDPPGSLQDSCSDLDPTLGADRRGLLVRDRPTGEAIGYATLVLAQTANLHSIDVEVYVDRAHRGRGAGTALVRAALDVADAESRPTLNSWAAVGGTGSTFARNLGTTVGLVDQRSTLDVSGLDRADIERLAAAPTPGYEVLRWRDHCPDEYVAGYIAVNDAMNTAPRGDLSIEDRAWDVAQIRSNEERRARTGVHGYTVVARHSDTGDFAGFTEVVVPPSRPATAFQEDTAVVPGHRGHGLGLVLKATMLDWLHQTEPQLRVIQTWNAASNEHMLRVNYRLGFVARDQWELLEAPVATVRARLDARAPLTV